MLFIRVRKGALDVHLTECVLAYSYEYSLSIIYFLTINLFQLQQEHLGDLLISVMYQPTNNRIVVVVMKAAKLKKMDFIGACGKILSL